MKYWEYKLKKTYYSVTENVTRPYGHSWFLLKVRNKLTGQIEAEDGFGRTYGFQSPRKVKIMQSGVYDFELQGDFGWLTLAMTVKKEENIPGLPGSHNTSTIT